MLHNHICTSNRFLRAEIGRSDCKTVTQLAHHWSTRISLKNEVHDVVRSHIVAIRVLPKLPANRDWQERLQNSHAPRPSLINKKLANKRKSTNTSLIIMWLVNTTALIFALPNPTILVRSTADQVVLKPHRIVSHTNAQLHCVCDIESLRWWWW